MFKICGINPGEFILDGKPLAEKGAAVKETVVINSVARKVDVDKEILPPNKLNYFKAKKEHIVDGISYYVSTRYNREQGIAQLEKMLLLLLLNQKRLLINNIIKSDFLIFKTKERV